MKFIRTPMLHYSFLCAFLLLAEGCASLIKVATYDTYYKQDDMRFYATKADFALYDFIAHPKQGFFRGSGNPLGAVLFTILDLPFSLVTDFVMLPLDQLNHMRFADDKPESKNEPNFKWTWGRPDFEKN